MPDKRPDPPVLSGLRTGDDVLSESMRTDLARMMGRQLDIYAEAGKHSLAERVGLSLNEYKALEFILEFDRLSSGQLAQLLDLSASGTSALISRLVRAGYVQRSRHPLDKRMVALSAQPERCGIVLASIAEPSSHTILSTAGHNPARLIAVYDFLFNSIIGLRACALQRLKQKTP
ncbi:MarR family winged helix-turn-helix transcriptional regulator [Alcaligenes sp. SDU_A2]|uniref:MarR family winged helix-turn-helix transcriptional regulator n=1 Tax=Alcaligenes sp. SDU_A2 TaxID=3136634 RepID=UPI00311DB8FE